MILIYFQITNFLFKGNSPFGFDLLSMDINRGRDLGIPPYTTMRPLCGLPAVNRFEDLKDVMDDEVRKNTYNIGMHMMKFIPFVLT